MNDCNHPTWVSLEKTGVHIEVTRQMTGNGKVKSLYEIIELCDTEGCFAGRTRDGYIVPDIRKGEFVAEGITVTSALRAANKEG